MKKIIITIILFSIAGSQLFAQYDKVEVFEKIKKKYGNISAISVDFFNAQDSRVKYSLKAQKGNKFNLRTDNRRIISNGKTIWNYSVHNKNVIISDFDEGISSFTLDYFFFNVLPQLVPIELKSELSSSMKKNNILLLNYKNKSELGEAGFNYVKLFLSSDFSKIMEIELNGDMGQQNWVIQKIKANPKLKNKLFEFKAPKDVEIIDYR